MAGAAALLAGTTLRDDLAQQFAQDVPVQRVGVDEAAQFLQVLALSTMPFQCR